MEKEVIAYKAFFEGLTNRYDGINYEVGKVYSTSDKLGYTSGGFHMCEEFEDCFKYLRPSEDKVELTLVKGFGNLYCVDAGDNSYDDRLGNVYICEKMQIIKVLSREEIIQMALNLEGGRAEKFIESFPLTLEEAKIFKEVYSSKYNSHGQKSLPSIIDYYQKERGTKWIR